MKNAHISRVGDPESLVAYWDNSSYESTISYTIISAAFFPNEALGLDCMGRHTAGMVYS